MNRNMLYHCKKSITLPVTTHTKNTPYASVWFISLIKYIFEIRGTNILGMQYGQLGTNSNPMKFYLVTFSNQSSENMKAMLQCKICKPPQKYIL